MKKSFLFIIAVAASVFLFNACKSSNYIEDNYEINLNYIKNCEPYTSDGPEIKKEYRVDQARAAEIREYFKENTALNLDELAASSKTTWEKSIELAVFVAKNIPHNNQKEFLVHRNAITLWEYSRRIPTGFNCRWHATLLSELLLSIGIRNHFVTCLPYDENDGDCHVVNVIWLPELNKWAMLDSDMVEYVTGKDDIPLSLQEMREYIQNDKEFTINVLPGLESSWVAKDSGKKYLKAYWTKNLYWFELYTVYTFGLESEYNEDGTNVFGPYYIKLVPPRFDSTAVYNKNQITSNAQEFWSY